MTADGEPVRRAPPNQRVDHWARYRALATPYRDGTWNHDVSHNIQALLAAIARVPPYRILDLGSGPGRDLVTFRDLGDLAVGRDGCPEFVAMAARGFRL